MTRRRGSWTIVLVGLALLRASSTVAATDGDQAETVSLARIRRALAQPPLKVLTLPSLRGELNVGDFKVEVHEKKPDVETTILDSLDFTPGPILSPPALYPSAVPLIEVKIPLESVAAKIRNARRARAEQAAQAEALEALREFCATHVCSDAR